MRNVNKNGNQNGKELFISNYELVEKKDLIQTSLFSQDDLTTLNSSFISTDKKKLKNIRYQIINKLFILKTILFKHLTPPLQGWDHREKSIRHLFHLYLHPARLWFRCLLNLLSSNRKNQCFLYLR